MIVGGSKKAVIAHIAELANAGELNAKAELDDPNLSPEASQALTDNFYRIRRHRLLHAIRRKMAYQMAFKAAAEMIQDTTLVGLEKLSKGPNLSSSGISAGEKPVSAQLSDSATPVKSSSVSTAPVSSAPDTPIIEPSSATSVKTSRRNTLFPNGAIVTSNHFNPLDSILPLTMAKQLHKRLYIVSQESNLALPKPLNFLTNNMDLIPLMKSPSYLAHQFKPELKKTLAAGHLVLIYPEEEMWFYYRKPRPCRRGAYQFAAECGVPIISCFTELRELATPATDDAASHHKASASQASAVKTSPAGGTKTHQKSSANHEYDSVQYVPDNDEFYKLKYIFHILGVLYPDPAKSPRENSIALAAADYALKKSAYESIYGEKLDYKFKPSDIAGYRSGQELKN